MSIKEYLYIVFHPRQAFAKLRSYIAILESRLDITPTHREVIINPKMANGLLVLGDETIVKGSQFFGDELLIIHPDAKHTIIMYCDFIDQFATKNILIKS